MRTKLLMVTASKGVGGMEKLILDVAQRLHGDRFDVEVAFVGGEGRFPDAMRDACGERVHVFHLRWWDLRELWRVLRCLRAVDPEVIQCFGFRSDLVGRIYAHAMARPALVSWIAATRPSRPWLRRWLNRWTSRRVSAWLASCRAQAELGVQLLGVPADRIEIIHPAVDIADDPEREIRARRVRERLGIPEEAQLAVTVGNLRPVKGHPRIVEAAPEILRKAPDTYFVFVGEDLSGGAIPQLVERSPHRERFHLVGFVDDPLPYLVAADLVLQPSLDEGLPRVTLESAALGKMLLTTAVGGIPEVVDARDLLPAGGLEELARETAARLLGNTSTRYLDAARGSVETMASRFAELYASCARSSRKSDKQQLGGN